MCRGYDLGTLGAEPSDWTQFFEPWAMKLWPHSVSYLVLSGDKQGAVEFLKLIFRALCLCWDRQTQDLHVDWILFRGRSLIPVSCEVVNDNIDGYYPSSHYPIFAEFMLPRNVRLVEAPSQDWTLNLLIDIKQRKYWIQQLYLRQSYLSHHAMREKNRLVMLM